MDNEFTNYPHENLDPAQDWVSAPNLTRTDKDVVVKDFYTFNNVEASFKKGRRIGMTFAPSLYTALLTDFLILVQSVSVAPTITLPPAKIAGLGKIYIIKDVSGSALSTTITIARTGTDLINGDTGSSIATNYGFLSFFTDGINWFTK